jgi:hypothetical protein
MYASLGQAAKAAGVSRSAILRAIRAHRISACKADTGDWQIDPAELHRVFPPATTAPERHDTALQAKIDALRDVSEKLLLAPPQRLPWWRRIVA